MSRFQPLSFVSRDTRGATAVEFAFILPLLLVIVLGGIELGMQSYIRALLDTAMDKAARDLTLPSAGDPATRDEINEKVRQLIQTAIPQATASFSLKSVDRFSRVSNPSEDFIDTNDNNICDDGETFTDVNGNGLFDADVTATGWGQAEDVIIYSATITYPRLAPLPEAIGLGDTVTISSQKFMKIEPFAAQAPVGTGTC